MAAAFAFVILLAGSPMLPERSNTIEMSTGTEHWGSSA
jgi:hypothetical protein